MGTLLSTKVLDPGLRELCLGSGLGLVAYNALSIEFLPVEVPMDFPDLIFTSQNAVKAFLQQAGDRDLSGYRVFCVGQRTAALLGAHGLQVAQSFDYAALLAPYLVATHPKGRFLFLCGEQRSGALPEAFDKNGMEYRELPVYRALPRPRAFQRNFEGILFFSPLGIRSHLMANELGDSLLFCIGDTTAKEAAKHSKHILIAERPTVENVLVRAINHFRHD